MLNIDEVVELFRVEQSLICSLSVEELGLAKLSILHSSPDKLQILSDLRFMLNLDTV